MSEKILSICHGWWMSSSIGQKPNLFLSATCGEMLSWMIEIWMKNHLVIATLPIYNPQKNLQRKTNNVGFTFSVGGTIPWVTISIGQHDQS